VGREALRFKVTGGTAVGSKLLCTSCSYSQRVLGFNNETFWGCTAVGFNSRGNRIPFPVYECNVYKDASRASLMDMKEIAWVVRTDAHGRKIGFVRSGDLTNEERQRLNSDLMGIQSDNDDY